ncbi:TetR/AcrR family transcriptional regulator [Nonomuraea dietziae]|uniref:AcrR family transcriptional regulator n=1 Tax=Nonomuraea dietziae TaxID=65515 RepID=A0A7W5V916_9ACTN|nr:TetR/AcrR family transcriptional regulator [Nonomuraea dietziae]MBB3730376.1 AcrR family transcriptional regulator [Nonomuraea dietziae]
MPEDQLQATSKAARTRERILDAALDEFSAKGYSGARTAAIAKRAGVNVQLISYYFGGKEGLLEELLSSWQERRSKLVPASKAELFLESFRMVLNATLRDPRRARLVVWQALGDYPGDTEALAREWRTVAAAAVEQTRARQAAGEISEDHPPEFVTLLSFLLAFAPVALPQVIEEIYDVDPLSEEYRQRVSEALAAFLDVRHA